MMYETLPRDTGRYDNRGEKIYVNERGYRTNPPNYDPFGTRARDRSNDIEYESRPNYPSNMCHRCRFINSITGRVIFDGYVNTEILDRWMNKKHAIVERW